MHTTSLYLSALAVLGAISSTAAVPTNPTNFLLVTTSQKEPTTNSTRLKAVSATSLFDPFNSPTFYLRLQYPGYSSLPNFTLSDGTLHTWSPAPHGSSLIQYNSTSVQVGKELTFSATEQEKGNIELEKGYLITVNGVSEGWEVCEGEFGEEVLFWKAGEDEATGVVRREGCERVWMHAVGKAPY